MTEIQGLSIESIAPALRSQSAIFRAGATLKTGLINNEKIPSYSGSAIHWTGETDPAENGTGTFRSPLLSPKRLSAEIFISAQASIQQEKLIPLVKDDIARAIAEKIESTILGGHEQNYNVPDGLFTGVPTLTITGEPSADKLMQMEAALSVNKGFGNTAAFIVSPRGAIAIRKALIAEKSNDRFTFDGATLSNQKVFLTECMTDSVASESGIVLGNWSDLIVGVFGDGVDITFDDMTQAINGYIRLVINFYCDIKIRRPESFILSSIKTV